MPRPSYRKLFQREQLQHYLTLMALQEELIHFGKIMRAGGLPEEAWFVLLSQPILMLAEDRFSEEMLEKYCAGHQARWEAVVEKYPELRDERICEAPEMRQLDEEFSAAKDRFTADLFRCYGLHDLGERYLTAREDFERRAGKSREFLGARRHHFATTGYCWCGSDPGEPPDLTGDTVWLPDLLPECRQKRHEKCRHLSSSGDGSPWLGDQK